MPGFLYADDLVLCGKSEEDLRVILRHFVKVCRRRGLKVNEAKRKGEGAEWTGEIGVSGSCG